MKIPGTGKSIFFVRQGQGGAQRQADFSLLGIGIGPRRGAMPYNRPPQQPAPGQAQPARPAAAGAVPGPPALQLNLPPLPVLPDFMSFLGLAQRPAGTAAALPQQLPVFNYTDLDTFNRAANAAVSSTIYQFGNYRWATDAQSRVCSAEGRVQLRRHGRRTTDGVTTTVIGRAPGHQLGDVGFHLIADQFNGPINRLNVVPGNGRNIGRQRNLNTGAYAQWERAISRQRYQGNPVEIKIVPMYDAVNGTVRPDRFQADYRIGNGAWVTTVFRNRAGG